MKYIQSIVLFLSNNFQVQWQQKKNVVSEIAIIMSPIAAQKQFSSLFCVWKRNEERWGIARNASKRFIIRYKSFDYSSQPFA